MRDAMPKTLSQLALSLASFVSNARLLPDILRLSNRGNMQLGLRS